MIEESVVQLTGDIDIRVDTRPIDRLEHKLRALMRLSDTFGRKLSKNLSPDGRAMNKLAQQKKAEFATQMQASKFTLATQQQQAKLNTLQTKQALEQAKVKKAEQASAIAAATAKRKADADNIRAQGALLQNKMKSLRLSDLEERIKARQLRAERLIRAKTPQARTGFRNPFHGGGGTGRGGYSPLSGGLSGHAGRMAHNSGGFGGGGRSYSTSTRPSSSGGASFGIGAGASFGGLAAAATAASVAIAAMTAAAFKFVSEAEKADNAKQLRNAQFKTATGSDEGAKRMEVRYQKLSDYLGLDANEGGRDYGKLTGALAKRMGVDQSEKTAEGIMSYGKAQGMSGEEMKNMNRGLLQALGKNQLYAEEWTGQIAEHLGANANQFGAEAYQNAIGGKLTGQAAADQFMKDRKDGKIKGDVLVSFMKQLGIILGQHANDGGALDVARHSQESRKNRISNQMSENLTHAYGTSGLKEATGPLYESIGQLLKSLGPQFDSFAKGTTEFVNSLTSATKSLVRFIDVMNSTSDAAKKEKEGYVSKGSQDRYAKASEQFDKDFGKLGDILGKIWSDISGTKVGEGAFDGLANFWSSTLTELSFIARGLNQVVDALLWVAKKFGYEVSYPQTALKTEPGAGVRPIQPGEKRPTTAVQDFMQMPQKSQEPNSTIPAQPLVVPMTPDLISPSTKAQMGFMKYSPAINPPVIQPAAVTNTTTVTNTVTVQSPNITIEGSTHSPEEIAKAMGLEFAQISQKQIEDTFNGAAAQQTNRYGQ